MFKKPSLTGLPMHMKGLAPLSVMISVFHITITWQYANNVFAYYWQYRTPAQVEASSI
ncbi:hypothetical protein CPC08DRAFT_824863 [Agrocybe pediades]|nr:hypothetical protein CPC08DRAFT_824863 [Agrocybe pediades]